MKRTSMEGEICSVARSLDVIGDWWSLLIVRDALAGLRRFGEFQRNLGAAKNILTTRLRTLVADGILETAPASDGSAYLEYRLTDKGHALVPVLIALSQWSNEHVFQKGETRITPTDKKNRQPLKPLRIDAADGRTLAIDDVYFALGPDHVS